MRTVTYYIGAIIAGYLVLDVFGFLFWILSGQYPIEGSYYVGKVTATILSIII